LFFYFVFPIFIKYGKITRVPDLKDTTVESALDILSSMDLKGVVFDSVFSDEIKRGKVVYTIPKQGKEIRFGRTVKLIISKGGERVPFVDVKGLNINDARRKLQEAGFFNIIIMYVPVSDKKDAKENIVLSVIPDSVKELEKSEKITLFVSKKQKDVFLMPNIIDMTLEEAMRILSKYGLKISEVKKVHPEDSIIIVQNPLPGVEVYFGESVSVILGK
jgi:serine/threonine-protein kinase